MKVDTAEGANGDSNGALRDRRRSGMNGGFAARPPSILADSITTPIRVHETTKLNRLIHADEPRRKDCGRIGPPAENAGRPVAHWTPQM